MTVLTFACYSSLGSPFIFVPEYFLYLHKGFVGGTVVKNLPANAEGTRDGFDPWVQNHPQEKEMATCFSILACKIPWTEETGRRQSTGLQRVRHD